MFAKVCCILCVVSLSRRADNEFITGNNIDQRVNLFSWIFIARIIETDEISLQIDAHQRACLNKLNIFSALHRPLLPCCDVGAGNPHTYHSFKLALLATVTGIRIQIHLFKWQSPLSTILYCSLWLYCYVSKLTYFLTRIHVCSQWSKLLN